MDSTIRNAEGKEFRRIPVIEYGDLKLPILEMDREAVKQLDPNRTNPLALVVALLDQMGTQNNVIWCAMHALAKDIYERDPDTPNGILPPKRHFQDFAKEVGLVLRDQQGNVLDVGQDLEKV
jgi:hypothetical protein